MQTSQQTKSVDSVEETRLAAQAINVRKTYGSGDTVVRALDDLTVSFERGTFHAIMGPSGSGKSTLLHCLAGLDDVSSGDVFLGGVNLATLTEQERTVLRRTAVGFVFQSFNLIPTLTAEENVLLPSRLGGQKMDPEWLATLVRTLGLEDRLTHKPGELSGGQQQRVAAARAFATRPDVVFADEPTGALDSISGGSLLAFMREIVEKHEQTVVMVTHDPTAASYADRVVFLADGRIIDELSDPTADKVLDRMKTLGSHS